MAFDPLSWGLGFIITETVRSVRAAISSNTLGAQLSAATKKWSEGLPEAEGLIPEALFPKIDGDVDLAKGPALRQLRAQLRNQQVPSANEWSLALLERWNTVRFQLGESAQPFFSLAPDKAKAHLDELGLVLHAACVTDEALFKATVFSQLDELAPRAVPQPAEASDLRSLHLAIEAATGCRIDLVLLDKISGRLFVWGRINGASVRETKRSMLNIACVAANTAGARTLVVGSSASNDLAGTDGSGPIGTVRVHFSRELVAEIVQSQVVPLDLWERITAEVLIDDNSPFQKWERVAWRSLEDQAS